MCAPLKGYDSWLASGDRVDVQEFPCRTCGEEFPADELSEDCICEPCEFAE